VGDSWTLLFHRLIHTDGKPLYEAGFGMMQAIGHADFYPNEGFDQPGCRALAVGCSHGRSHEYYSDSQGSGARWYPLWQIKSDFMGCSQFFFYKSIVFSRLAYIMDMKTALDAVFGP